MRVATQEAYQLLHEGSLAFSEMEANGLRVDVEYLRRTRADLLHQQTGLTHELLADPIWKRWQKIYKEKSNLGSGPQLARVIFQELGIKPQYFTAKGQPSTKEEAFEDMDIPFVQKRVRLEKLKKANNTFLKGIEDELEGEYLRPHQNLHTTKSYRGSASDPNSHNWPIRDPEIAKYIRSCFVPRDNHSIVEVDYSGIEVKAACFYNKDPQLMRYVSDPSTDMHRDMAAQIFKLAEEDVQKVPRYCAKNMFVFPEFYGDWYKSCCQKLWHSVDRMKLTADAEGTPLREHLTRKGLKKLGRCIVDQDPVPGTFEHHLQQVEKDFWQRRFRVYTEWKNEAWEDYKRKGYFTSLTGFMYQGIMNRKQVINWRIQGTASNLLLWGIIRMSKWLRKKKMRSKLINTIHDSVIGDVHRKERDDYIEKLVNILTKEVPAHFPWINVPLAVEVEAAAVGESWQKKVKVELS